MASFYPCVKNAAAGYTFYVGLVSQANTKILQAAPTLAAGDFQVSIDGGSLTNLGSLPTVTPAAGRMVKIVLSQAEINGDNITVVCSDAAGAQWCDLIANIQTVPRRFDDLAYPATTGRSMVVDANGLVDANAVKVGPTGTGTAQTARDLGLSVLLSSGTGAGQLDFTSGVTKASLAQILGTALTEGGAGRLTAAFKLFFDLVTPTSTMNLITAVATVNALANGAVTAAAIALDAIDADALATDALTEIQASAAAALVAVNLDHIVGTATGIPTLPAGTFLDQVKAKTDLTALDSTVAKASTALDKTMWTDAKAGFVDVAVSGRAATGEAAAALAAYDGPTKTEMDAGLAALNDPSVAEIWASVIDGTTDATTALQQCLAMASGDVDKSGDAYAFKNRAGATIFTLTIAAGSRTRS